MDALFTREELSTSLLFKSKISEKDGLDKDKVEKLFGMLLIVTLLLLLVICTIFTLCSQHAWTGITLMAGTWRCSQQRQTKSAEMPSEYSFAASCWTPHRILYLYAFFCCFQYKTKLIIMYYLRLIQTILAKNNYPRAITSMFPRLCKNLLGTNKIIMILQYHKILHNTSKTWARSLKKSCIMHTRSS